MSDDWGEENDDTVSGKRFGGGGSGYENSYKKEDNNDNNGWDGGSSNNEENGGGGYGGGYSGGRGGGRGRGGRGGGRGGGGRGGRGGYNNDRDNDDYGSNNGYSKGGDDHKGGYGGRDGYSRGGDDYNKGGYGGRGGRGGGGRSRGNDDEEGGYGDDGGNRRGGGGRGRGGRGGRGRGGFGRDENGDDGERGGDRYSKRNNENGEGGDQKPREFYIPPEPTNDEDEMFNSGISSGINFGKYNNVKVEVSGENPPVLIKSFDETGLRDLVMENVRKSGYTVPTPIQKAALPIISDGRDLMACAQTGSGKTAAFLLPIINTLLTNSQDLSIGKPQALVVSPTRELTIQIFNEARKFALNSYLKVNVIYGGTSSKHQGENISRGCHILIATPGRLKDFVDKTFVSFEETRFVVLDEADRMLDMGFKEDINKLMNHPTMRPMEERQNLMFSATFPEEIQRLAGQFLNNYLFVTVGIVGGACTDVEQNIFCVKKFQKREKLFEILTETPSDGTIVFVETKRGTDFLASLLSEREFPSTSIHGDRLQSQREGAIAKFKSGEMKILITTSVCARGLDIKNVAHVINYDLPKSIDEYVHRIGRTGRVGNRGKATSFFDPEQDGALAPDLVKILKQAEQDIPSFLENAGGGGGGGGFNNKFGGRDFRKNVDTARSGPEPLEEEEDWN